MTEKADIKEIKYSILYMYSWYDFAALQGLV